MKKAKEVISFYTIPHYERWKAANNNGGGWTIKYYKGLGTSTQVEASEYFSNMDELVIQMDASNMQKDLHALDIAFNKKKSKARKKMIDDYDEMTAEPLNYGQGLKRLSFAEWVERDLILFMRAANVRAIPRLMDGFKDVHRKVLFGFLKTMRSTKKEYKLVTAAGRILEHAAYHHGEVSLAKTLITLARSYVGSNNINLLAPLGQFGNA